MKIGVKTTRNTKMKAIIVCMEAKVQFSRLIHIIVANRKTIELSADERINLIFHTSVSMVSALYMRYDY